MILYCFHNTDDDDDYDDMVVVVVVIIIVVVIIVTLMMMMMMMMIITNPLCHKLTTDNVIKISRSIRILKQSAKRSETIT
jgi:uncharacterized protein (DUF983 family)